MSLFGIGTKKVSSELTLGDKTVQIPKLTPVKWKALFEVVDRLPHLFITVLSTSGQDDFASTLVAAAKLAMDEVAKIVSVLSGLDEDYILENVGTDEIIDFLIAVVEKNRLQSVAKNLKSLLPKAPTE
ncbi:hypothetical protein FO510_05635 [Bacillus pumilus]|uniref:hypothetical protein n=1 Tax=Bacillus pumilus TaxID=1408 RepID=UPI00017A5EE5|nr:hypothetical protein [Bacillus pumilus]EDW22423.1 hypothetical protein BAT_0109 [Bacillus pumilus ATCC 7061]MCR4352149.1 hypothetical protein [Bacillus pumilus]MCY7503960.1 hypothetical protein [Bacillus pumilus]MDR4269046.1 hypothetical protein [Bacillus pumilus]MDR4269133.1 hypothetical protein [Bacillus pumilus]